MHKKLEWRKFFQNAKTKKNLLVDWEKVHPFLYRHKKLFFAALFYFLAMLSKEPAVLLPALFIFFDLFIQKIPFRQFVRWHELQRYIVFIGAFLLYMGMRIVVLGGLGQRGDYYGVFSIPERVYAFVTLFGQYMEKLLYPYPLLFYYPFEKPSDFFSISFFRSIWYLYFHSFCIDCMQVYDIYYI